MRIPDRWRNGYALWIELFAILNLAFLALDIYLAHSENAFRMRAEYLPLWFSLIAPPALLFRSRVLGFAVAWTSVLLGCAGVLFHLQSGFFQEHSMRSLTYAAPFVAPLAYTGIGLLLVMNRMVATTSREWAYWVLLFALGGFAGNFVLSLTDHAIDGFYRAPEWIPVASSAMAVGFLAVPFCMAVPKRYWTICAFVLLFQIPVGLAGFAFHCAADLAGPAPDLFRNAIHGAPPFAPLLFPNLSILGLIGLRAVNRNGC